MRIPFIYLNTMTNFLNSLFITCDAPRPWGIYFQDSASPQMEALVELHDNFMFYLVIILIGVAWTLVSSINFYYYNKYFVNGRLLGLIWTIIPALTLFISGFIMCGLGEFEPHFVIEFDLEDGALRMIETSDISLYTEFNLELFSSAEGSSDSSDESSDNASIPVEPEDDDDRPDPHSEIALCDHVERTYYPWSMDGREEQEVISNTACDLSGDRIGQSNMVESHNAFPSDYQGDSDPRRPTYCLNCFAVICDDCGRAGLYDEEIQDSSSSSSSSSDNRDNNA